MCKEIQYLQIVMGAAKKRNRVRDRASLKRALGREVREDLSEELRWAVGNSARTKGGQTRCLDPQILGRRSWAGLFAPVQCWPSHDLESECLLKSGT